MSSRRSGSLASLREGNRRLVIEALRERGVASRAELARATELSRSTISTIVGDLIEAGLAVERDGQPERRGPRRPPRRHGRPRSLRGPRARASTSATATCGSPSPTSPTPSSRSAGASSTSTSRRAKASRRPAKFVDEVLDEAKVEREPGHRRGDGPPGADQPPHRNGPGLVDPAGLGRDRRGGARPAPGSTFRSSSRTTRTLARSPSSHGAPRRAAPRSPT